MRAEQYTVCVNVGSPPDAVHLYQYFFLGRYHTCSCCLDVIADAAKRACSAQIRQRPSTRGIKSGRRNEERLSTLK